MNDEDITGPADMDDQVAQTPPVAREDDVGGEQDTVDDTVLDAGEGDEEEEEEELPDLQYETLTAFVESFIAPLWECNTALGTRTWCPMWWKHDGAVFRLTALWQSWESMRVNDGPTAAAAWLTTYADPIMAVLLDGTAGPFDGCDVEHGHRDARHPDGALPTEPPPADLFEPRDYED